MSGTVKITTSSDKIIAGDQAYTLFFTNGYFTLLMDAIVNDNFFHYLLYILFHYLFKVSPILYHISFLLSMLINQISFLKQLNS